MALACLSALLFGALSCSDDDSSGTATVVIDSVDPTAGYENVEFAVNFTITPGNGTTGDAMAWRVDFGDGSQVSGEGTIGTATHAYELSGTYEIKVSAVYNDKVVGSETTSFQVFAPIDLAADGTRGAPANVQTGDDFTVSVNISNSTASDVLTAFDVTFYFSEESNVTPDETDDLIALGTVTVNNEVEGAPVINTGEERNVGFTATIPEELASGDYFILTVVDPEAKVGDTDRTNNFEVSAGIIRVENLSDSIPDVEVRNLFVIPDRAFPELNEVTRGFTLANNGAVDAFEVVYKTYLSVGDDTLDAGDTLIDESDPVNVLANDLIEIGPDQIVLDNSIVPPMNEELTVYVIVQAELTEAGAMDSNEANNTAISDPPITVSDQPVQGPDIVVNSFSVTPNSTFLDGTLSVSTSISNEGTNDVGSFFCGIYLGSAPRVNTQVDPRLDNINIPSLAASDTLQIDKDITVPGLFDPGVYYLYIVCDPQNALNEPFRSNNTGINLEPITITDQADVDMFINSVSVDATVDEGNMYTLTAEVCVQGSNPSGRTIANVFRTGDMVPNYNAEPVASFEIDTITPGNCQMVTVDIEAACEDFIDTYAHGLEIDVENTLPEYNEANNRRAAGNTQTVNGTFCACNEDGFEPNNRALDAVPLTAGQTSAALCEANTCDYFGVDLLATESLVVTTAFQADKGGLITRLFDPSGIQVLDQDNSADSQAVGVFLVPQAGRYVFSVCGLQSTDKNLYDLDVAILQQSVGVDILVRDTAIPAGGPFSIGTPLNVTSRLYNLGTVASAGFDVQTVVSPDAVFGDANDVPITTQSITSIPAGGFRDITVPSTLPLTLTDGDYYIGLVADPTGALTETDTANNTGVSRLFGVRTQCFDPLEPNDTLGEATDLADGTYSNLVVCDGADDFYRICPNDAQKFTITTTFDETIGDIDIFLTDEQQNQIDASASAGGVEQVAVDYVNGSQCYFLQVKVIGLADPESSYELDIDIQDVDPALQCDAAFEPNDSFTTASSLLAATGMQSIDRCPVPDSDMYYVDLTAGQQVTFTAALDPAMQQGTLRLQIYRPNQTPGPNIETAPGVPTAQITNYIAPTTGRYYAQITVSGSQRKVTYTLDATGLGGIDLTPQSLFIGPGTYSINDEVRFGFDLQNLGADLATAPPYEIWYSDDAVLSTSTDIMMGTFAAGDVAGNATIAVNDRAFVPGLAQTGTRYLFIVVDGQNVLNDTNQANNTISVPITIVP